VRQSQVQDDPVENLPTFYKKVFDFIDKNDVERLVLDVRLNGGGNNYKNKPIIHGIIESQKINKPGKAFRYHWSPHFFRMPKPCERIQ
jgi:C-terminal processing protease CtpA/Prc